MPRFVLEACRDKGFVRPTPIQMQCWPIILSGHDLIGISQTGTGKTLAYLGPAILHINSYDECLKPGDGPICLVVVPTRELAIQVQKQARDFGETTGVTSHAVFGGIPLKEQESQLKEMLRPYCPDYLKGDDAYSPPEILVATLGRLQDFLRRNSTNLLNVTYFVLDEVDKLVGLDDVCALKKVMPPQVQTLMFSATYPETVRDTAKNICRCQPIHVYLGQDMITPCEFVEQRFVKRPDYLEEVVEKVEKLYFQFEEDEEARNGHVDINGEKMPFKFLMFLNKKAEIEEMTSLLRGNGINALSLHGDLNQYNRNWVMEEFKSNDAVDFLIATDLASRGLDLPQVACVIMAELPKYFEEYVHRIGRTGRAGRKGFSYSMVTRYDYIIDDIARNHDQMSKEIPEEIKEFVSADYDKPKDQEWGSGWQDGQAGNNQEWNKDQWDNKDQKQWNNQDKKDWDNQAKKEWDKSDYYDNWNNNDHQKW